MAYSDRHGRHARHARRHDGALLCTMCVDTRPREDNDWCPVSGSVVCDDCCRDLMLGEERALLVASEARGHDIQPEDVISVCTSCERLIRLVSEHAPEDGPDVRLPMH